LNENIYSVVAAIDVGTNNLRMTIVQVNEEGEIIVLEDLKKPTTIGNDTFTIGRIMIPTMHDIVKILKGFRLKLKEYKVKSYKAVATSAFREAENREYVLEHIHINTGFDIEVINNSQERYYMYQALGNQSLLNMDKQTTLVLNIASGGVEISIHDQGELKLMEYMNIGALRIHEMLSGFKNRDIGFSRIMEEFIYGKLSRIVPIIKKANVRNFIGLGSEINTIFSLCSNKKGLSLENTEVNDLFQIIKGMTNDKLMETYNLTAKQVETLLPSIILLNTLLVMADTKHIDVPMIELHHGIIYKLTHDLYISSKEAGSYKDIINSAWYINNKYGLEKKHSEKVLKLCISIFEQTNRLHKLGTRECLYLQIAAILHGMGYYVNYNEQTAITYELIKKQNIMGLSNNELEIIANIAFYYSNEVPRQHHQHYQKLTFNDKIVVVKLAAILKLADSLDVSHIAKISLLNVDIQGDNIYFTLQAKEHTQLEEWVFSQRIQFFEEVMGVRPKIKFKF
jgi:exopolyphosphatase/guanosine-5'-triphosphate,3'-diphosphate pyrophosphatase